MLNIIQQNITTVTTGIICQQVNCQGVMGAGLAKQIRAKFPPAYEEYMKAYKRKMLTLGNVIYAVISFKPPLYVANLCGQNYYGREKGRVYTDYASVRECLTKVSELRVMIENANAIYSPIYIPYFMGCGLAGGNWDTVYGIIEETIPDAVIAQH